MASAARYHVQPSGRSAASEIRVAASATLTFSVTAAVATVPITAQTPYSSSSGATRRRHTSAHDQLPTPAASIPDSATSVGMRKPSSTRSASLSRWVTRSPSLVMRCTTWCRTTAVRATPRAASIHVVSSRHGPPQDAGQHHPRGYSAGSERHSLEGAKTTAGLATPSSPSTMAIASPSHNAIAGPTPSAAMRCP